jgi:hypothetical protein
VRIKGIKGVYRYIKTDNEQIKGIKRDYRYIKSDNERIKKNLGSLSLH